jgi:hypothetical protein
MAEVVTSKNTYLHTQEARARRRGSRLGLIICLIAGFLSALATDAWFGSAPFAQRGFAFVTLFVLLSLILYFLTHLSRQNKIAVKKWQQGRRAESDALDVLVALPANTVVLPNLVLPGVKMGNIDYVVVAPGGIWVLELKSHKGTISAQGNRLLRNGQPITEKDFVKQVLRQAEVLHGYLRSVVGYRGNTHPVLVFSNPSATISPPDLVVNNVPVLHLDNVVKQLAPLMDQGAEPVATLAHHLRQYVT